MRNKIFAVLSVWMLLYAVLVALMFNGTKQPLIIFGVVIGVALIGCGSFFSTSKPTSDAYGRTQQYIIATTVQILGALGFILFARFAATKEFKFIAIHFLIAFIVGLFIQSTFLLLELRKKSE